MRTLSIRTWLGLVWLTYLVLPVLVLILTIGVGWLFMSDQPPGTIISLYPLALAPTVVSQLMVPVMAAVVIGWMVLKPLAAMSRAAGQVAKQDLDFTLPTSRVREVQVSLSAFTAMGEELRVALQRQAELEQERQFFISAIAHDIHTPIFALRGYLEGLARGVAATPDRAQHYIQTCQEKVGELDRLAADLFAYTKIDRLEQTVQPEPLDLSQLLAVTVEGVRQQAAAKAITISLDGPNGQCRCIGDAHLLQRAIANLLENAIRYTPTLGTITVAWGEAGDGWRCTVTDTGPGIAPHDLPHLFAPFYRGEASRNRATGGAGLGLAIAHRIIQAHAGQLTAANDPQQGGAMFVVTLPGPDTAVSTRIVPALAR